MKLPVVTYKPGYEVSLTQDGDFLTLVILRLLPDANAPAESRWFRFSRTINLLDYRSADEMFIKHWVREAIVAMEMHEMNEWLKADGKRMTEPHGESR